MSGNQGVNLNQHQGYLVDWVDLCMPLGVQLETKPSIEMIVRRHTVSCSDNFMVILRAFVQVVQQPKKCEQQTMLRVISL